MRNRRFYAGLVLALFLAFLMAGCGEVTPEATATPEPPDATATPVDVVDDVAEPTATPDAQPDPADESTPTSDVGDAPTEEAVQTVAIPPADLQVAVPETWVRLEPGWIWAPDAEADSRVGVAWADLQPPQEPEAALLPENAQIVDSVLVDLAWGQGRQFLVEVYGEAPQEGDQQAPVVSVETHVLVVVTQDSGRVAYDFFATAPTLEQLESIEPILHQMLASVTPASAPASSNGAPAEGSAAPSEVVDRVKTILADQLGVAVEAVELVSATSVEWPNGCLGVESPGEMCAQVIVPGYRMVFDVEGQHYEVHTDATAQAIAKVPND